MQNWIKIGFIALLITCTSILTHAQKYGHMNSGNLLSELPEMKAADKELLTYQDQLVAKGETMVVELEAFVKATNDNITIYSPLQLQEKEAEATKMRQAIAAYEQEVIQKLQVKRQELLAPILDKVQTAIDAVAKEQDLTMVFDTSVFNAVLYAQESADITAQVKAKLGL